MVGGRREDLLSFTSPPTTPNGNGDLESGLANSNGSNGKPDHSLLKSPNKRFRDAISKTIDQRRAEDVKRKILQGMDRNAFEECRKNDEELKEIGKRNKAVKKFYEKQNERLDDWLEVDTLVMAVADDVLDSMNPSDLDGDGIAETGGALQANQESIEPLMPEEEREKRRKARRYAQWAININVIANIFLLGGKGVAAGVSTSLSLIASLVDSALDLLCTLIVWTTNKLVKWRLKKLKMRFPVGRQRLEPLGILVFSIIMIVSFIQILQESVTKLLSKGPHEATSLGPLAIGAMAGTVVIKGIIWFGCIRVKTTQVQALAQDCKTDVIFNTLSLLFPVIGHAANVWWLDPVGAGLLSLFIIYDWASTCLENVSRLTGVTADDRTLRKMMFLAFRFSPVVDAFKTITAYHAGDGVWVEIDCLLDGRTPLKQAHDVAETIQYCAEGLGEVDRAFVTMDYTSQGPTGHATENS